jgi:hypothetical protein
MPTVQQILKDSGFTDEQITALEPKAITAFSSVLSQAEAERRANADFYDQQIVPSLTAWDEEANRLRSEAAYYRAQNEAARAGGFIPQDAPGFGQSRDGQGRYVANGGGTPGSPTYVPPSTVDIDAKLGQGLSNVAWAMQTHQQLTGQMLPDSFDKLAAEASASRLPFRDYVARKYDYAGKQEAMEKKRQEEHDNQIRKEAEAARDKVWAERTGSNPDVRAGQASRFGDLSRARANNLIPDPLSMNETERRVATRQQIRNDMVEQDK